MLPDPVYTESVIHDNRRPAGFKHHACHIEDPTRCYWLHQS